MAKLRLSVVFMMITVFCNIKGKGKVHPSAGTEALYRPCGPYGK